MSGDDLTIALFLSGTAIAFGLTAVTLAGWTNRALVVSLFSAAFILFVCAIFWPTIGENWVGLRIFLHDLIANYFGFRAVGLVVFFMFCFDFARNIGWISTKNPMRPPPMTVAPKLAAREFFRTNDYPPDIKTHLKRAKTAVFWGTAFAKFIPDLRDDIEERLKHGLKVRFLLIKPLGAALEMANLRGRREDELCRPDDLNRSLYTLSSLAKTSPGTLECKVIDYLALYTMVSFDAEIGTGRMFVWLATLGIPNTQRPMFELTVNDDPEWFGFFAQQFELTWNKATEP
jgi:hypothetical protein